MPTKPTGRPRGRPKGSKAIPSLEEFVSESIASPPPVPPPPPKKKISGIWANMTPEERSAYAKKIGDRSNRNGPRKSNKRGIPKGITKAQFEAARASQIPIIERIMKKMADTGQLPDDPMAVEALKEAMTVLRSPITPKEKIAAARLVLDFTKAKPTAKVEHTVRTAEDYLDDMAEDGA